MSCRHCHLFNSYASSLIFLAQGCYVISLAIISSLPNAHKHLIGNMGSIWVGGSNIGLLAEGIAISAYIFSAYIPKNWQLCTERFVDFITQRLFVNFVEFTE